MTGLYDLIIRAKNSDQEALVQIIKRFEPKIKKSSQIANYQNQEDLEQELKIELLKLVERFEYKQTPGFWQFLNKNK
ncbi:helix-turn-helix domain-containing protein [Metabacillus idriensis]|uniref:helix-turn-helix domain-containing protein n=1 Tax=Metabacillus idriensis TaxID=324768 RepID=UPI0008A8E1D4|nr:helix-turn-helix domain-containing protein [Metabacillus idriensis]MCM3598156.1 helix-turn-helix domain-containing protein [Metabacillus idriensis]OHR63744.1 hypothetical protein HMPREF3291_03455 [Bacillus sp. HMSC76G11]